MVGAAPLPHPVHNPRNPLRKLGGLTFASPNDPAPYAFTSDIASLLGFIDILAPNRPIFQAKDITLPNDRQCISQDKVLAILEGVPPDAERPGQAIYPAYLFANSSWRCDLLQSKDPGYKLETCFWSEIRVDHSPGQFQLPSGLCWRHRKLLPDPSLLVKNISLVNTPSRSQWEMWRKNGFPRDTQATKTSREIYILGPRESAVIDPWCGRAEKDTVTNAAGPAENPLPSPPLSASPIIAERPIIPSRRPTPSIASVDSWTPPVRSRALPNHTANPRVDLHPDHTIAPDRSLLFGQTRRSETPSRSLTAIEEDEIRLETRRRQLAREKENQLKSSLANLERRLARAEDERDGAIRDLREMRDRVTDGKEDYREVQLQKAEEELRLLEGDLRMAEDDRRLAQASIARKDAIIGDLKRQLEDDSMSRENAVLRQEVEHLEHCAKKARDLDDELGSARTQITRLKSDWTAARVEASQSTAMCRSAKRESDQAKKDVSAEQEKTRVMEGRIAALTASLRQQTVLAEQSIRDLEAAKRHTASLVKKNAEIQKRVDDSERECRAKAAKIEAFSQTVNVWLDRPGQIATKSGQENLGDTKQDDHLAPGEGAPRLESSNSSTQPGDQTNVGNDGDDNIQQDDNDDLGEFMDLIEDSEECWEDEKGDCDDEYVQPGDGKIEERGGLDNAPATAAPQDDGSQDADISPSPAPGSDVSESVARLQQQLKEERQAHARTKQQLYDTERDCRISQQACIAARKSLRAQQENKRKKVSTEDAGKEVTLGDLHWFYKRKVAEMKINPKNEDVLSHLLEEEMDIDEERGKDRLFPNAAVPKRRRRR